MRPRVLRDVLLTLAALAFIFALAIAAGWVHEKDKIADVLVGLSAGSLASVLAALVVVA